MKNTTRSLFITFIFMIIGLLSACAPYNQTNTPWNLPSSTTSPNAVPAPTRSTSSGINGNQTINVAILLPLSGRNAALGESMLQAAQMALFEINNPNLNLVPRDTNGTSSGAAQAAQSAIQDGAQLILGPVFADSVRAVKPIARQQNINVIAFSTDQTLADRNTFLMGFMPATQASDIAAYAVRNNLRNVSVITPRDTYGNIVTTAFENALRRNGGSINQIIRYTPNDPDLGSNIAAMSSDIDAVFMPAGANETRAINDYLDQNNMPVSNVKRLGTGLWDTPQILQNNAMNGAQFAGPSMRNQLYYKQKYNGIYGQDPVRIASLAFDATALSATLIQNAQRRGLQNAFSTSAITDRNGFAGTDGVFRFNSNGLVERKLSILEIQNGTTIEAAPAATQF